MNTSFSLVLNMKTVNGFESFGNFCIGKERTFAYGLFSMLKGSRSVSAQDVLHMDLVEKVAELPVNIMMINCTLDDLVINCRIISKELFRIRNLEPGSPQ